MKGKFAARTKVTSEQSRGQIESVLMRYGASKFGYMLDDTHAMIGFEARQRRLRFIVPFPDAKSRNRDQEIRQRWRGLLLAIKAKLEAVEIGLSTFEDEFLPYTVLPDGQTVSEWIQPQMTQIYSSGKMPPLLLSAGIDPTRGAER